MLESAEQSRLGPSGGPVLSFRSKRWRASKCACLLGHGKVRLTAARRGAALPLSPCLARSSLSHTATSLCCSGPMEGSVPIAFVPSAARQRQDPTTKTPLTHNFRDIMIALRRLLNQPTCRAHHPTPRPAFLRFTPIDCGPRRRAKPLAPVSMPADIEHRTPVEEIFSRPPSSGISTPSHSLERVHSSTSSKPCRERTPPVRLLSSSPPLTLPSSRTATLIFRDTRTRTLRSSRFQQPRHWTTPGFLPAGES